MPVTINGTSGIIFNDSTGQSTAIPSTLKLIRPRSWAFSTVHGPQPSRQVRYISRYQVVNMTTNPYYGAQVYTTVSAGNDTLTWVTGARPVRVIITSGIYSYADDYVTIEVIRDGTIVNATTHSGGTTIFSDNNERFTNGGSGEYTNQPGIRLPQRHGDFWQTKIVEDIPANTTRNYFNYVGLYTGNGADGVQTFFQIELGAIL